jgi:predicted outer membrane repeat protein
MIGELIPTGVTFGAGRISLNDQFSGTAEFNNVEVSGNLSAGTGGAIYSGGTDLYSIFSTNSGSGGLTINPYINVGGTGSTITWNVSGLSTNYEAILVSATTTLNLTNVRNGEYGTIILEQDGVGSRTITLGTVNGSAATHKVVNGGGGAPTLTSTAHAVDILSFTYNGSEMYWTVGNDYT